MIANRFDRFVLLPCLAAMVENRIFVYYFSENSSGPSWLTLMHVCFTFVPDLIVILLLSVVLCQSHQKCNLKRTVCILLSLVFIVAILATASMNITMLLAIGEFSFTIWASDDTYFCAGRPINWVVLFQIDWNSAYTLGIPELSRFLMILLSQFILALLLDNPVKKHIRDQRGHHRTRTMLSFSHHRISRLASQLALGLTMILLIYDPPDLWKGRSKNVLWDLILSNVQHQRNTDSFSRIYLDKSLVDYITPLLKAPPVDFSRTVTSLRKPIKHVFLIILESVRADILPLDPKFAERIGSYFYEPVNATDVTPFLNSIWQSSVHGVASTMVSYTLKSLLCTLCGMYPMPVNFLEEIDPRYKFYQECLPDLIRQTFQTSKNQSKFRSAFFTAARDNFDRQRQLIDRMHFDDAFNGYHITNRSAHVPDVGIFGPSDTTILPFLWKWIDSNVAKDRARQLFINLLTTGTHHPFDVTRDEERRNYKYYLEDYTANKYLNALRVSDKLLKEIFQGMKSRGLYDQTLFIITSDHAHGMNDRGHKAFGSFEVTLESSFSIPIMLHNPHLRPQSLRGQMTNMDILPTIMDVLLTSNGSTGGTSNVLLSNRKPALKAILPRYEGRSLLRQLVPSAPERYTFHLNNPGNAHLIVKQYPFKLVYAFQEKKVQLYHLEFDPDEKTDLIGLESQPTSAYPQWLTIDRNRSRSKLPERKWSVEYLLSASSMKEQGSRLAKSIRNSSRVTLEQMLDWADHSFKLARIWTALVKSRYENTDAHQWSTKNQRWIRTFPKFLPRIKASHPDWVSLIDPFLFPPFNLP